MCYEQQEMEDSLQSLLKEGGEGIVLRKPSSLYEHGRSPSLFKLKVYGSGNDFNNKRI